MRCHVGARGSAVATTARGPSLYAIAGRPFYVVEVGIFNTTDTEFVADLQRLSTTGTQGAALTEIAGDDDAYTPAITAFNTHTADATAVAGEYARATLGAAKGAGVIWTFGKNGTKVPAGTTNGMGILCPSGVGQTLRLLLHLGGVSVGRRSRARSRSSVLPHRRGVVPAPPSGGYEGPPPTTWTETDLLLALGEDDVIHPNIKRVQLGQSLQVAYDALPGPLGVTEPNVIGGALVLDPGRHNVGTGLQLDRRKPVTIMGAVPRWKMFDTTDRRTMFAGGAYLYSSTGAVALIDTKLPATEFVNGQGFAFYDLGFDMGTNCDYGIRGDNLTYTDVIHCRFFGNKANRAAIFLCTQDHVTPGQPHGGDASWWKIENCTNDGGTFFQTVGVGNGSGVTFSDGGVTLKGYQHNNIQIRNTISFAGTHLRLYGMHRSLIMGNNWEGVDSLGATKADRCFGNFFIGNGGEAHSTGNNIYYWLTRCNGNYIADMGPTNHGTGTTTLVRLTNQPIYGGPTINTPGGSAHYSVDNTVVLPTWAADTIPLQPNIDVGVGVIDDHPTGQNWKVRAGGHHIGSAF